MQNLHHVWIAAVDWLHKAFPICPIIFGMVNGHRRRTDRGPVEQVLIALVVQILTAAAAVVIGVYVAVQIIEVRVRSNEKAIDALIQKQAKDEQKAEDHWDQYLKDRADDAYRKQGGVK